MKNLSVKSRLGAVLAAALALSVPATVQAQTPVSSAKVVAAITRGVNYLLSQCKAKTYWEQNLIVPGKPEATSQFLGETALITESLLDVGQSLKLPQIDTSVQPMKGAINFLVTHDNKTTYATSFQANVLALLPQRRKYQAILRWDARFLVHSMHTDGGYHYAWGTADYAKYFPNVPGDWDNSNTQYGVLGAWAVEHAGLSL
ncbi:conserved hypothetical protein, secreted, partial [mine drainage metagenome]